MAGASQKLRAYWSKKENDIVLTWPDFKANAHYLRGLFDDEFLKEMKQRGFDITTMRFEITRSKGES